jgi:predicted component of type VI protein secretion system
MLVALKKRLALTDYAKKLKVVYKYNKLKTYSKRELVEKWLRNWETTYIDGKELQILEVANKRLLIDFTTAILAIDLGYALS